MTRITQTVREQAFLPLECDVPDGMTLDHYRASRPRSPKRRRRTLRVRRR